MKNSFTIVGVVVGLLVLLAGVRQAQLRPHVVKFYVMGQLRGEQVVTNPAYLYYTNLSLIDAKPEVVLRTNYYWRVWRIFQ